MVMAMKMEKRRANNKMELMSTLNYSNRMMARVEMKKSQNSTDY